MNENPEIFLWVLKENRVSNIKVKNICIISDDMQVIKRIWDGKKQEAMYGEVEKYSNA